VAPGVRLHCLPVTTPVILRARRAIGEAEAGTPVELQVARAVACEIVTEWEGIGDAQGKPLKITPEGIVALLDVAPVFAAFEEQVIAPAMLMDAEKNVSAPSPNGLAAGAKATAKGAKPAARNVRRK
jgi:hypothetical protein